MLTTEKGYLDTLDESEARHLSNAYIVLAAKLMRYVRGGGDITQLRGAVLEAGKLTDLTKKMMNGTFEQYVAPIRNWQVPYDERNELGRHDAQETLAKGALQFVASRLDRDAAWESHGERELAQGASAYREYLAQEHAAFDAKRREAAVAKTPTRRKRPTNK